MEKKGLIIVPLSPKDFVFGAESGVAFKARLSDGKWFNYSPTNEKQYRKGKYDTMSCTTFSALNSLEMQANYLLEQKEFSGDQLKLANELGLLDSNGKFNFNDWFTAVMSGTSTNGNDFGSVWESIRKHGVLGQSKGMQVNDFSRIEDWLDKTNITTDHKALALRSLELFDIKYEFILTGAPNNDIIEYHLTHAPIHIATAVCAGWDSDSVVKACPLPTQHATCIDGSEKPTALCILDHYEPFHKKLAYDYPIPWAVKGVLEVRSEKKIDTTKPVYTFTKTLQKGSTGKEVEMLQRALKWAGCYKLDYFTQYFGQWTEDAVKAFQLKYATDILYPIGLTLPTGKWAKMSIKKMNELLQ